MPPIAGYRGGEAARGFHAAGTPSCVCGASMAELSRPPAECPACKEHVYDPEAMRAIEANSPAFAKSVVT